VLSDVISGGLSPPGFPHGSRGRNLMLAGDFSGTHSGPLYTTYAFLLLDLDRNTWWFQAQRAFRMEALRGGRRLSFKALNDRKKRGALPLFLMAADQIEGALVVIAVARNGISLFKPREHNLEVSELISSWKAGVHEHLLRVVHLSALCVSLVSQPDQNLLWISDQDEIVSNDNQITRLTHLFAQVWGNITSHALGHLQLGSTRSDDGTLALEDLAAIPDLGAGAACEAISGMRRQGCFPVRGLYNRLPIGLSAKTDYILRWLAVRDRPLRRVMVVVDPAETGTASTVTRLTFGPIPHLVVSS
jgi:hypothetical protein